MITPEFNSIIIILIFGSLILLSFLTIANPLNVNKKANSWFGIFLFLWSTFRLDEIAGFAGIRELSSQFTVFLGFIQFFTPILFYLSIVSFTNPNNRFSLADTKYLVLPMIYLMILLFRQTEWGNKQPGIRFILLGLILLQVMLYSISSYIRIRKHQQKILLFSSSTNEIDLNWLEYIITSVLLLSLVISIYDLFLNSLSLNISINIACLIVVFSTAYFSLKQKEIFPADEKQRKEIILIEESEPLSEMKKKLISDADLVLLKSRLIELMQSRKSFLDCELNLIRLAELIPMTPHQLSYVINSGFNENFFHFINKFRVEKAKELLLKEEVNNLSILGIAFESGFNSKTSFNTTYKKITGLTPSEFKKRRSGL